MITSVSAQIYVNGGSSGGVTAGGAGIEFNSGAEVEVDSEGNILVIELSSGERRESETTAAEAKESASAQMGTECNDCTVQIVEVRSENQERVAYKVQDTYRARFLAIFPVDAKISAYVDAETGQVIDTRKSLVAILSTRVE